MYSCLYVCVHLWPTKVCKDKYRLEPVWLYNVKLSLESWCVHVVWKHTYKWNELWIRIYEHYYHHPHPTHIITKWTLNLTNECTTVVWRNYYLALDNKMCMTWIYRHNKFKLIYIYIWTNYISSNSLIGLCLFKYKVFRKLSQLKLDKVMFIQVLKIQ